jgi:hypothetical protein
MGLKLNDVPASAGMRWVGQALADFLRQPLGYSLLFIVFFIVLLLVGLVPALGAGFLLVAMPLLSLAYMMAAHGAAQGQAPQASVFLAPWRSPAPDRRRPLLALLLLHAALTSGAVWLGQALSDGGLGEWFAAAYLQPDTKPEELTRLANQPGVTAGALSCLGLLMVVSLLYWFAPALVVWAGQGVGQALFSSALALWRARWAFLNYIVVWFGVTMGLLIVANFIALVAGQAVAALLVMPVQLMLTCTFYISLYHSFRDCFGEP